MTQLTQRQRDHLNQLLDTLQAAANDACEFLDEILEEWAEDETEEDIDGVRLLSDSLEDMSLELRAVVEKFRHG